MSKPRSILILSGGLDSTVAAFLSQKIAQPLLALTFDYGQKSALREKEAAKKIAEALQVPHKILFLPWLSEITETALVNPHSALPHPLAEDLNHLTKSQSNAAAVWVPNRNGLFLNIAACFAEHLQADLLVTGFNREEGTTFPDNSADFVAASDTFFNFSTLKKVRVLSPTLSMNKTEIARTAKELSIPFQDLWFCYEGKKKPCEECESCKRNFRAFQEAEISNPWSAL